MEAYKLSLINNVQINDAVVGKVQILLQSMNCKFMMAPYEADTQLAYLYHTQRISGIISEDSDYLAWGCNNLITKMDKEGNCEEYSFEDINNSPLCTFTTTEMVFYSVLCGCDYAKFKKIGEKNALVIVKKARLGCTVIETFENILKKIDKSESVMFCKAVIAFLKSYIRDPTSMEVEAFSREEELIEFIVKKYDLNLDFII